MYPARAMARRDIELLRPGLLEAVRDIEAMGLWECLRRAREPLEAATLAAETSRSLSAVHAALDLLARAGLVRTKKARGRRRAVAYTVAVREPVCGELQSGFKICSAPPPSSGGIALLQMLAMLEPHALGDLGHNSTARIHLVTEVMRRAFREEYGSMVKPLPSHSLGIGCMKI